MKIAVLSDIHGNLDALNSVLEDIKDQECEKIYFLGDYAMAGPEPVETLERVLKLKDEFSGIKMIQGNTDLLIADFSENSYENLKKTAPVMAEALKDDVRIMPESQIKFLANLPKDLHIEEEGVKILLVHGSPRKNNENILPDTPLKEVEEMVEDVKEDIIFCGHTHMPCGFQTTGKKTVVNAGSVGRPFTENPQACYLVLTLSNGKCIFEHRFVDYDNEKASKKILKRTFAGKEKLAQTLIKPEERHF